MPLILGTVTPASISGLTATVVGFTVQFTWTPQNKNEKVEIWKNTTNNSATATLLVRTTDHNFADSWNQGGNTAYYFLRLVNSQNQTSTSSWTVGPWSTETLTITGGTAVITDGSITGAKLAGNAVVSSKMDKSVVTYNGGGYEHVQFYSYSSGGLTYNTNSSDGSNYATLTGFSGSSSITAGSFDGNSGTTNYDATGKFVGTNGTYNLLFNIAKFQFTGQNVGIDLELQAAVEFANLSLGANSDFAKFSIMIGLYDYTTSASVWQYQFSMFNAQRSGTTTTVYQAQPNCYQKVNHTKYDTSSGSGNQLIAVSGHSYTLDAYWYPNIYSSTSTTSTLTTSLVDFWAGYTFRPQ
jgi:hypothetical protein